MNTIRLIIALHLAVLSVITTPVARSASFSMAFYEETGDLNQNGHNFFDDYTFAGGGTFEINDSAVVPNNSVLFSDSAFVSFEASFTGLSTASSGDITTFTLGTSEQ
jgi:hypothetical protein